MKRSARQANKEKREMGISGPFTVVIYYKAEKKKANVTKYQFLSRWPKISQLTRSD